MNMVDAGKRKKTGADTQLRLYGAAVEKTIRRSSGRLIQNSTVSASRRTVIVRPLHQERTARKTNLGD